MKTRELERLDDLLGDFIAEYCANRPSLESKISDIRSIISAVSLEEKN